MKRKSLNPAARRWSWQALRRAKKHRAAVHAQTAETQKRRICEHLLGHKCRSAAAGLKALRRFGITGIGFGVKVSEGKPQQGVNCVRIYVERKRVRVPERLRIPARLRVPGYGEIVTDVIELSSVELTAAFGGDFTRMRTLPAGTFGCVVQRGNDYFILSNNHVLTTNNNASLGQPVDWCPSWKAGGWVPIAKVDYYTPIDFSSGARNLVDAAIAYLPDASLVSTQIVGIGRIRGPVAVPFNGMEVQKSGASTGVTYGVVEGYREDFSVPYGDRTALFTGQIAIKNQGVAFTDNGDSGSLIMTRDGNHPVGLHFCTSKAKGLSFCSPIRTVLSKLGVDLVPPV